MSEPGDPAISPGIQPKAEDVSFDLHATLSSVLLIRTQIPDDALTAPVLGTERAGHGVLIGDDNLILTIGYLITEAETIWLVTGEGKTMPGHVVGYDQESGFGLVQALAPLDAPVLALGRDDDLHAADPVIVAGHGGATNALIARVIGKREFAGYWEYVLDEAIYTSPAHPNWGGTALIGRDGRLYGIGSLLVQQVSAAGDAEDANMHVPIDLLKPILEDLRRFGRPNRPARPWLGLLAQEMGEHLVIARVYEGCPADRADLRPGDIVVLVGGEPTDGLADMFRQIWSLGPAGVEVPLTVVRDGAPIEIVVQSADRNDCIKAARLH